MNIIQPLDQVREIVATALNHAAKVGKSFQCFFIEILKVLHNASLYQHIKEFFEGLKSDDPQ